MEVSHADMEKPRENRGMGTENEDQELSCVQAKSETARMTT